MRRLIAASVTTLGLLTTSSGCASNPTVECREIADLSQLPVKPSEIVCGFDQVIPELTVTLNGIQPDVARPGGAATSRRNATRAGAGIAFVGGLTNGRSALRQPPRRWPFVASFRSSFHESERRRYDHEAKQRRR
jgi:hypothetical protein